MGCALLSLFKLQISSSQKSLPLIRLHPLKNYKICHCWKPYLSQKSIQQLIKNKYKRSEIPNISFHSHLTVAPFSYLAITWFGITTTCHTLVWNKSSEMGKYNQTEPKSQSHRKYIFYISCILPAGIWNFNEN